MNGLAARWELAQLAILSSQLRTRLHRSEKSALIETGVTFPHMRAMESFDLLPNVQLYP